MNTVLLIVDSLRFDAVDGDGSHRAHTPFFEYLKRHSVFFRRAYATECWTLPSHLSMFTGLLPSEHGAHFSHMCYSKLAPTVAETLTAAGLETESATRNPIFDGSIPGVTRGFQHTTQILSDLSGVNPLSVLLALSKPRFRNQIRTSGFFTEKQRRSREFVRTFARSTIPADQELLDYALSRMNDLRTQGRSFFLFVNLYDVHAPYPPSLQSIFRPTDSLDALVDNVRMSFVLPLLGGHAYLREGFRLSGSNRRRLMRRYRRAVEMMDGKLEAFYNEARAHGLLEDTLLIIASDHGEAFGDHGLYLHDASVWNTHLQVPLFVVHPDRAPEEVDDVVSTAHIHGLIRAAGLGGGLDSTILSPLFRRRHPVAIAQHFHYRQAPWIATRYRADQVAAICANDKVKVCAGDVSFYDLAADPGEEAPRELPRGVFSAAGLLSGLSVSQATAALQGVAGGFRGRVGSPR